MTKRTESIPAMVLWLLVPIAIIITVLVYSCEPAHAQEALKPTIEVTAKDAKVIEQNIRSQSEYQLRRTYSKGIETITIWQSEKLKEYPQLKIEKDGKIEKIDELKKQQGKSVPIISKIIKAISEWGMVYADEAGDTAYENIIAQDDYEIIWTYEGSPAHQVYKDVQSASLCDGETICRVRATKTYINGWSQGFSDWVAEVTLI